MTAFTALLLKATEDLLQEEVILVDDLPRREICFNIVNVSEAAPLVNLAAMGVSVPLTSTHVIGKMTDPAGTLALIPVLLSDDFWQKAFLDEKPAILGVAAGALNELIFHLFNGSIDESTLAPKIYSVLRPFMT